MSSALRTATGAARIGTPNAPNCSSPPPTAHCMMNGPRAIDARVPICSATSTGCQSGSKNSAPGGPLVPLREQAAEHRDVLVVGDRHVVVVADEQAVEPGVAAARARSIIQRAPVRTSMGGYPLRSETPIFMGGSLAR